MPSDPLLCARPYRPLAGCLAACCLECSLQKQECGKTPRVDGAEAQLAFSSAKTPLQKGSLEEGAGGRGGDTDTNLALCKCATCLPTSPNTGDRFVSSIPLHLVSSFLPSCLPEEVSTEPVTALCPRRCCRAEGTTMHSTAVE